MDRFLNLARSAGQARNSSLCRFLLKRYWHCHRAHILNFADHNKTIFGVLMIAIEYWSNLVQHTALHCTALIILIYCFQHDVL